MDRKFLKDGSAVEVVSEIGPGRILVAPIYCSGDDEYTDDLGLRIVDKVFDTPPTMLYHEEIQKLRDQRQALQDEMNSTRDQHRKMIKEQFEFMKIHDKRMKEFAKFKPLEMLEAFIEGKITHYVEITTWGKPRIIEFNEADSRELRLLSLFGKSNGDLSWRLNRYYDNSGCSVEVIPVCSLEAAEAIVRDWVIKRLEETKDTPEIELVLFAGKSGIDVPQEYINAARARARLFKQKKIDQIRAELAKNLEELEAM